MIMDASVVVSCIAVLENHPCINLCSSDFSANCEIFLNILELLKTEAKLREHSNCVTVYNVTKH